uniref:uncharacterized protein LOC129131994 n=1 Tax=Agelaius phoeniceus TaxID=39638 RepID=UPI0023ED4E4E|nr:uncharacterized protein LOC129131994 [Agelaius phoeniceus]
MEAIAKVPGEGAVTRNPPGGDPIESGETGGPGATHPSSSPKPPEPSEPPGDPLTPSGDPPGPRPPPEPPRVPADPSPNPSPPLADLAQEAEGLARSFWEGLAAEARNIERASARASGGGDPPPYPFEYGADGREEGWSPPVRGRTNPEPRPAANTHARETSAEPMPGREPRIPADAHAWGCDRGQALTREPRPLMPPYMGEIPPCGRQGEPRGRHRQQHQHRPRGEERGRSRTKRQQRPEVYWQSTSDSEGSHSSPDRSAEPTESSSDSEAEKTESMRFRTKPIKTFNTVGNQPQYELTDWAPRAATLEHGGYPAEARSECGQGLLPESPEGDLPVETEPERGQPPHGLWRLIRQLPAEKRQVGDPGSSSGGAQRSWHGQGSRGWDGWDPPSVRSAR